MDQRFSITSAVGITVAIMVGLAIYAVADLTLDRNAVAAHVRPPKGAHEDRADGARQARATMLIEIA